MFKTSTQTHTRTSTSPLEQASLPVVARCPRPAHTWTGLKSPLRMRGGSAGWAGGGGGDWREHHHVSVSGARDLPRAFDSGCVCAVRVTVAPMVVLVLPCLCMVPWRHGVNCDVCGVSWLDACAVPSLFLPGQGGDGGRSWGGLVSLHWWASTCYACVCLWGLPSLVSDCLGMPNYHFSL